MTVKFMWNGIKVDGKLYRAHYSIGNYTEASGIPKETITVYAKDYTSIPRVDGLQVENDTDIMTDYFETDRIRIAPDNKFYNDALEAVRKQEEHYKKRFAKRYGTIVQ